MANNIGLMQNTENVVGIYIDNSFSMNGEGPDGKAIESAKQKAYSIVDACKPNTKFVLLTNSLNEKENRFYSNGEVKKLISDVEENHQWTLMSNVVLRFKTITDRLLEKGHYPLYLISDFQKRSSDIADFKPDSTITYNLVTVPINNVANLYIDSCWFDAPTHYANQLEILSVRVANGSDKDYRQIPVNLYINDTLKALASANIEANGETTVVLQYSNPNEGVLKGRIEITDYPIVHDNSIFLSYQVKSSINTLLISENNEISTNNNFRALFKNNGLISLETTRADRIQISQLPEYAVIFLNELRSVSTGLIVELQKYVVNGGTLVVIPPSDGQIEPINQLLSTLGANTFTFADTASVPISTVQYEHALYKQVFKDNAEKVAFPVIKYRYIINESLEKPHNQIIGFANQSRALSEVNIGTGKVYLFSFPLSHKQNEFVNHALFMPTFYNMALYSLPSQKLYHVMGNDKFFEWSGIMAANNLSLSHDQTGIDYIPRVLPHSENTLKVEIDPSFDAGWYTLFSDNKPVGAIAYNYALDESDLSFYAKNDLENLLKQQGIFSFNILEERNDGFSKAIEEIDRGKQFWKWFVAFAVLFLLAEAAIAKLWK